MKNIIVAIIVSLVIIGVGFAIGSSGGSNERGAELQKVYMENGKQIVDIKAKGGYSPQKSIAKAGVPTIIRFNTSSTFDCSSIVRIPSLGLNKALPPSGKTDIDIGIQNEGIFRGSCGMGMYPFQITFES